LRTIGGIMLAAAGAFEVSEARHGREFIRGGDFRTTTENAATGIPFASLKAGFRVQVYFAFAKHTLHSG
jgi:hypothetical protein